MAILTCILKFVDGIDIFDEEDIDPAYRRFYMRRNTESQTYIRYWTRSEMICERHNLRPQC